MIAHDSRLPGADPTSTMSSVDGVDLPVDMSPHDLMIVEFDHRFRNLLALVNAITRQTLNGNDHERMAAQTLIHRFSSLAATNSVFKGLASEDDDVFTVLEQELKPFLSDGDCRVALGGDPMILPGELVLALRLVLHELATNSLKHGALSNAGGHVGIKWSGADDDARTFEFEWTERIVQPIHQSPGTGFGFQLIRRALGARAIAEPVFKILSDTLLFTFSARADQPREPELVILLP